MNQKTLTIPLRPWVGDRSGPLNDTSVRILHWKGIRFELDSPKFVLDEVTMIGATERRRIIKLKVDSSLLNAILTHEPRPLAHYPVRRAQRRIGPSFNLMMITTDHKVLLLERSQSFHFRKVMKDLRINKINLNVLGSLYTPELKKLGETFFDFLPPPQLSNLRVARTYTLGPGGPKINLPPSAEGYIEGRVNERTVYIFPGGHSSLNETVILTLIRELQEETSINITIQDLKFNTSYFFNVLIYDCMVERSFNNYVFPVKVNMSSQDLSRRFKETRHTRNPSFVDIGGYTLGSSGPKINLPPSAEEYDLFEAFMQVQRFMLL